MCFIAFHFLGGISFKGLETLQIGKRGVLFGVSLGLGLCSPRVH